MYLKFFGFSKFPFNSAPDIRVFYKNGSRQEILEALVYTVSRGDGITKVTGEVGSGKTMLLRLLAETLPSHFKVLYINTPNLSPKDMLMHICSELALPLEGGTLKYELLKRIHQELVRLYARGQRVVMLIDEAQAMTFDTLEEIRLLSNLETSDGKLLQMVLFGQPELDIALDNDKLRQLKSRISYSIYIPPLSPKEVCAYLNYRVRRASYEGLDIFDLSISKEIHKLSGGMPRTINTIADKLLMSAYSLGDLKVTKKHLSMLPHDLIEGEKRKKFFYLRFFLITVLILLPLYFLYWFWSSSAKNILAQLDFHKTELQGDASKVEDLSVVVSEPKGQKIIADLSRESMVESELLELKGDDSVKDSVESPLESMPLTKKDREFFQVKGAVLSRELLVAHEQTVDWLQRMPEQMYLIQLASPHVSALNEVMMFYQEQGLSMNSIHALIDLGRTDHKNRLRVFYLASASYSTLERIISELPSEVLKSRPYIVTVGGVLKNLSYTQNYLKEHGII